jgi:DNA invertase Pin-like site-specific DNA recombinase
VYDLCQQQRAVIGPIPREACKLMKTIAPLLILGAALERSQTDRAQLRRLLDQLDGGDVVMVTRLDRLGRSTRDLLNTPPQ